MTVLISCIQKLMLYNDYSYFIPANGAEHALCFYRCITINYRIVRPGCCVASATTTPSQMFKIYIFFFVLHVCSEP